MTEEATKKEEASPIAGYIHWAKAGHRSAGIYDPELKRYVPTPRSDRGSRFYVTPAGIGFPRRGR